MLITFLILIVMAKDSVLLEINEIETVSLPFILYLWSSSKEQVVM